MGSPATTTRKKQRGRRICRCCTRQIDPLEEAVRVANVKEWTHQVGRLRYWLCWRCAGDLEHAIDAAAKRTVAV